MSQGGSSSILLVICLVVLLVLLVNAGLWAVYRNGSLHRMVNMIRRTGNNTRHPFQKEDTDLEELSRRVKELKSK
jgi:FtsZ-interacting cell division protein ZipA